MFKGELPLSQEMRLVSSVSESALSALMGKLTVTLEKSFLKTCNCG